VGGGISAAGPLMAENCIFTNNLAGSGAAMHSADASVTAVNCMVTNNKIAKNPYGTIETQHGEVFLFHCTVARSNANSSGVRCSTLYAYNSIIAGNGHGQVLWGYDINLPFTGPTDGNSLIQNINSVTYAGIFGNNEPDENGMLSPIVGGIAVKKVNALRIVDLQRSGLPSAVLTRVLSLVKKDLEGRTRPSSGMVTYGAVEVVPVASITISGGNIVPLPGSTQLAATILPANATNRGVTWSSSNTGIATVDQTGKVTGNARGNATITATAKDS